MPLKLQLRGKVWWLRGTVHGQKIHETTGAYEKEVAEALRAKREAGLVSDHVFGPKATRDFSDAATSYLEAGGDARFVGTPTSGLLGHFYSWRLHDITQNDLDEAARKLYPTAAPETLNRQVYTPFISVWNHAVRNKWADVRLWSRPKKPKGTNVLRLRSKRSGQKPVDYECAATFVAAMSPAPAMLMTFLFYTGMRPIEALALSAADIDLAGRWCVVRSSKTGEPRGVPLHAFLAGWLGPLVDRGLTDKQALFRTPRGRPYGAVQDGGGGLKSAIAGARRRTGILDVSPYTGRHTVSTGLVIAGVHPHIKDQILGHAADDMSRHYTNVPQAPMIAAVDLLPVSDTWRALPWVADPAKWWGRLADGTGRRTDLEARRDKA